jgi:flagellar operon protein
MSDYTKPIRPIITGTPEITRPQPQRPSAVPQDPNAFADLLRSKLQTQTSQELIISKHAQARAIQRGIYLSEGDMQRLGSAAQKANERGLNDTLVIMDQNAFLINAPNRVVITMVDSRDKETVFTNIDGAVIV